MSNTIRIRRRASGDAGAPSSLENAELAFNEVDNTLYYGKGTGGSGGTATTVEAIAGIGSFVDKTSAQTISGAKTFSSGITATVTGTVSNISNHSTDDLSEGSTNRYYSDSLVDSHLSGGTGINYSAGSISHSDTSTQSNVSNTGNTFIQSVDVDDFGHVTSLSSNTVVIPDTANDATITLSAGDGISGGGSFTTDQSTADTITFDHADTSTQPSVDNSGTTVIQDVTLDGYGHVTGLGSKSLSASDFGLGSSDNVTFNDVVVDGDLTVNGTVTTVNTETVTLADNIVELNSNFSGSSPTESAGFEVNRDAAGNKTLLWDETDDKWTVGTETFVAGTFEGDLTGSASSADQLTTARTISLGGDLSGSASFDGSSNVTISGSVANDSHSHTLSTISDAGSMASQDASNVDINGGTIDGVSLDGGTF